MTMTERDVSTGGGNAYNAIAIHEYSGVSIASPLDVAAIGAGITTNNPFTMSSPSTTTTVNGDLIFGFGNVINGPVSAGAGFTGRQTVSGVTEDLVQSSAVSVAATATDNANNDFYGMSMAAFPQRAGVAATGQSGGQFTVHIDDHQHGGCGEHKPSNNEYHRFQLRKSSRPDQRRLEFHRDEF